jgi:hypothetical protein
MVKKKETPVFEISLEPEVEEVTPEPEVEELPDTGPALEAIRAAIGLVELRAALLNLGPEARQDEEVQDAVDAKVKALAGR